MENRSQSEGKTKLPKLCNEISTLIFVFMVEEEIFVNLEPTQVEEEINEYQKCSLASFEDSYGKPDQIWKHENIFFFVN